ncbi:MAG: hypothetical protein QXU32_11165 [Nitrososphaerales archaeon]
MSKGNLIQKGILDASLKGTLYRKIWPVARGVLALYSRKEVPTAYGANAAQVTN